MDAAEFVIRLKRRYETKNETILDDLNAWLDYHTMIDYKPLYDAIIENRKYDTFPPLSEVKARHSEIMANRVVIHDAVKGATQWSAEHILNRARTIRHKQDSQERLSNAEADFIHEWDVLEYVKEHLEKIGWESPRVMAYVDKIKEVISAGAKFSVMSLPDAVPAKDQEYNRSEYGPKKFSANEAF